MIIVIGTINISKKCNGVRAMDKKKTGNLIKEARVKKNYTQSELGDLLGVSNKAVSRWENGDSGMVCFDCNDVYDRFIW